MTIARFSVIKMGMLMLLNLAAIGAVGISDFRHQPGTPFWNIALTPPDMNFHEARGLFLALICIMFIAILLRHLTFAKGAAVLVVDDVLLYPNFNRSPLTCRARLREVDSFSIAPRRAFRPPAVIIHFRDGGIDYIPTIFLTEPPNTILPRLSAALAVSVR